MEIYVRRSPLAEAPVAILVLGLFEDRERESPAVADLDEACGGRISRLVGAGDFLGKPGEVRILYASADSPGPERVLLLGLGKREPFHLEALRRAVGEASLEAAALRTGELAFSVPLLDGIQVSDQAQAIVTAATLALYEFDEYRSVAPPDRIPVTKLTLVTDDDLAVPEIEEGVAAGYLGAECQAYCRDLANTPAMVADPEWMAEQARELAARTGLAVKILEPPELEELGMGGLLGVARGSDRSPRLAVLEHHGDREDLPTVCLVGKGITFDSGGLSIKPSRNMHRMKFDKCGACVVIAAMRAVATLDLSLRVVGITPLAENMPSGGSYRPGDVLRCMDGQTIEVRNTDAEGRLILADALAYAARYEPDAIVDLATLTGSCVIALGRHLAGLMSNDDALAARLERAGEAAGEPVWRLPLLPDHHEQIKSDVADMKNIGGRWGGAITAACLLSKFVGDHPWAHLDIAGVSSRDRNRDYLRKGATGYGVRLIIEFLRTWAAGGSSEV